VKEINKLIKNTTGQLGEKYFDYFIFNIVNCGLQRSGARHHALARTIGNARGLDITSPLSARKITLKTSISSTLATRQSQQHSGARQQLCLRSWL
jgi:hypothetical protein